MCGRCIQQHHCRFRRSGQFCTRTHVHGGTVAQLFLAQTMASIRMATVRTLIFLNTTSDPGPHVIAFTFATGLTYTIAMTGVRTSTDFAAVAHPLLIALALPRRCTRTMRMAIVQASSGTTIITFPHLSDIRCDIFFNGITFACPCF